jgi:hypothetical protein
MNFRILHSRAGSFKQGQIVSDKQIKHSGADLTFWKKIKAVEEVTVLTQSEIVEQKLPAEITDPGAATRDALDAATRTQQEALEAVAAAAKRRKEKPATGTGDDQNQSDDSADTGQNE